MAQSPRVRWALPSFRLFHWLPPPPLPGYMSVFDAELYVASCGLLYAANLSPGSRVVNPTTDNQAAITIISRPGYSYLAPLHDIRKAASTLLLSDTAVQVGWIPSHTGIASNELADAAAKLAAEGTPSDDFPARAYTFARRSATDFFESGRPGIYREMTSPSPPPSTLPSSPPSPRSNAPLPDEVCCFLSPGPSKLASPGPGALPTVRGGD